MHLVFQPAKKLSCGMAELHVVTGLIKRRAELSGEIEHTHERLKKLIADLEHLDATIVQFKPDFKVEGIKPKAMRPPADWAKRGEMTRVILAILRQAVEPLSSQDVAHELITSRALDVSDKKLLRLMTKRAGVALRGLRDRGVARSHDGTGQFTLWELVRPKSI